MSKLGEWWSCVKCGCLGIIPELERCPHCQAGREHSVDDKDDGTARVLENVEYKYVATTKDVPAAPAETSDSPGPETADSGAAGMGGAAGTTKGKGVKADAKS